MGKAVFEPALFGCRLSLPCLPVCGLDGAGSLREGRPADLFVLPQCTIALRRRCRFSGWRSGSSWLADCRRWVRHRSSGIRREARQCCNPRGRRGGSGRLAKSGSADFARLDPETRVRVHSLIPPELDRSIAFTMRSRPDTTPSSLPARTTGSRVRPLSIS